MNLIKQQEELIKELQNQLTKAQFLKVLKVSELEYKICKN